MTDLVLVLHHSDIPISEWGPWDDLLEQITPKPNQHSWLMYSRINNMYLLITTIRGYVNIHVAPDLYGLEDCTTRITDIAQVKAMALRKLILGNRA